MKPQRKMIRMTNREYSALIVAVCGLGMAVFAVGFAIYRFAVYLGRAS